MGRRAQGWGLERDPRNGIYRVRFRHAGRRFKLSTGERDPRAAQEAAARLYAEAVSGRRQPGAVGAGPRVALDEVAAQWLADLEGNLDELTVEQYGTYVNRWTEHFETLDRVTEASIADYWRARLRVVLRGTVKKELSGLRGFLRWCVEHGLVMAMPVVSDPPLTAVGTRDVKRSPKRARVELTPAQAAAIIAELPELAKGGPRGAPFVVRARFVVAWETSLRPAALDALRAPEDYQRGRATLTIRDEIDKARFGRELPLSLEAREALDAVCPDVGLIFGRHDYREYLKAAGAKVLPPDQAHRLSPYDFRHGRLQQIVDETGDLSAAAYLAGHKHLTTTNHYLRAQRRAAERALAVVSSFGPPSGPALGPETKNGASVKAPSLVAGAKGGGRTPTGVSPQDPEPRGLVGSPRVSRLTDRQEASEVDGDRRRWAPGARRSSEQISAPDGHPPSEQISALVLLDLEGGQVTGALQSSPNAIGVCKVLVRNRVVERHVHRLAPINEAARAVLASGDRFVTLDVPGTIQAASRSAIAVPRGWAISDLEELRVYVLALRAEAEAHRRTKDWHALTSAVRCVNEWLKRVRMDRSRSQTKLSAADARNPQALLRAAASQLRQLCSAYFKATGREAPEEARGLANTINDYLAHGVDPGKP